MSHICSAQCESAGAGKREKRAWHRPGSPHSEKPAGNRQGMHWPPQSLSLLSPRAHKAPADPGESQPQGCLRSCPRGPPGGLNRLRRRRWREQGMPGRASGRAAVTHPKETMRRDSSGVQGRGGGLQNAHKVLQEETALDASRIFLRQRAQTLYLRYLCPNTEQPHSGAGRQEGSHPFPPSSLLISQEKREKNLLKHPRPSHPHWCQVRADKGEELTLSET